MPNIANIKALKRPESPLYHQQRNRVSKQNVTNVTNVTNVSNDNGNSYILDRSINRYVKEKNEPSKL